MSRLFSISSVMIWRARAPPCAFVRMPTPTAATKSTITRPKPSASRAAMLMFCSFIPFPLISGREQLGLRHVGHLVDRKHVIGVEEDDELALHLAHTVDEVGPDLRAESRRRLDVGGRDLDDFIDCVH